MSRAVFEPAQLPQETICPSVAFAKRQVGNSRGQSIIYYSINTAFVFLLPKENCEVLNSEVKRHFRHCLIQAGW